MNLTPSIRIVAIAVVSGILFAVLASVVNSAMTVYATPEMQTQFLRIYTPDRVLDRFRDSKYLGSRGSGGGAGADYGFATHQKGVDEDILMKSADRPALMAALDQDMAALLTATGGQIVSDTSSDSDGVRLHYIVGKSEGTVSIKPPEVIPNPQQYCRRPIGPGEVLVWVPIVISEKWFKAGVPSRRSTASLLLLPGRGPS